MLVWLMGSSFSRFIRREKALHIREPVKPADEAARLKGPTMRGE